MMVDNNNKFYIGLFAVIVAVGISALILHFLKPELDVLRDQYDEIEQECKATVMNSNDTTCLIELHSIRDKIDSLEFMKWATPDDVVAYRTGKIDIYGQRIVDLPPSAKSTVEKINKEQIDKIQVMKDSATHYRDSLEKRLESLMRLTNEELIEMIEEREAELK